MILNKELRDIRNVLNGAMQVKSTQFAFVVLDNLTAVGVAEANARKLVSEKTDALYAEYAEHKELIHQLNVELDKEMSAIVDENGGVSDPNAFQSMLASILAKYPEKVQEYYEDQTKVLESVYSSEANLSLSTIKKSSLPNDLSANDIISLSFMIEEDDIIV